VTLSSHVLEEITPFDRSHTISYSSSIVTQATSSIVWEIQWDIFRKSGFFIPFYIALPPPANLEQRNKHLAIANRSRVSCTHNTLRASIEILHSLLHSIPPRAPRWKRLRIFSRYVLSNWARWLGDGAEILRKINSTLRVGCSDDRRNLNAN